MSNYIRQATMLAIKHIDTPTGCIFYIVNWLISGVLWVIMSELRLFTHKYYAKGSV